MKSISQDKQNAAISQLRGGLSIRKVAENLGLTKSVVGRISKLHCSGLKKSIGGRPSLLSKADIRYCVQKVTRKRISSAAKVVKDLKDNEHNDNKADTVSRALHKAGLGAMEKPKKTLLSPKNIRERLA